MLNRLAIAAQLYPRRILAGGLALVVAGVVAAGSVFDVLKPFGFEDPASESIIARESLEKAAGTEPTPELVALVRSGQAVESRAGRRKVQAVAQVLDDEREVSRVAMPFQPQGGPQISRDGNSAYVLGFLHSGLGDKEKQEIAERLEEPVREAGGELGGLAMAYSQVNRQVESDLQRAELFAFPILFLFSLLVFRSAVAAALPLLVGGLSIMGALIGLRIGAEFTDLSIFAVNLVTGLGLGLAIDYSLFVVSRYREEMANRGPGFDALKVTMLTAGRTVLFSALTVAAALASLIIFPQRFLYSMGIGGSLVALFSALVALTILPATLALLGERVNALAPRFLQRAAEREVRPDESGFWYRLSHFVMRRPIPIATIATALLLLLGTPFLDARYTAADAQVLPETASANRVDDALTQDFSAERTSPTFIELRTRGADRAEASERLAAYAERLRRIDSVSAVTPPVQVGRGVERVDVFIKPRDFSDRSQEVVQDIRDTRAPFPARTGGSAAEFVDQEASLLDHIPIAGALLAGSTLFLLFLLTGSVILPIKTLIMNLLSVTVAFGILVFIFQDARLENVLDFRSQGALDMAMPLLLFATVFGLSTDYGIFLLTRIKEARDAGAEDDEAVAIGLERTGRIVSAAAVLLAIAIGALATSSIIFIKEYGIGVAAAVLVDATIVRAFLVPSLMKLLGRWNWWAPKPLRRLHDRIGISEAEPSQA